MPNTDISRATAEVDDPSRTRAGVSNYDSAWNIRNSHRDIRCIYYYSTGCISNSYVSRAGAYIDGPGRTHYLLFVFRIFFVFLLRLLDPPHDAAAFPTHPLYLLFSSICNCLPAICCIAWFGPDPVGAPASLNCGTLVPPLCANAFCLATVSFRYFIWSPVVAPVVW